MNTDSHGLPVSTGSAEAAALYRNGIALMHASWPGAEDGLERAVAIDPDFALAHAALARTKAMRSKPAEARAGIALAEAKAAANGTEREASHVRALSLALTGQTHKALAASLEHAARWPRDTVILSLPLGAFGLFAFSGMAGHDQARVDLCERHASQFAADDWWFLTAYGWALAENGAPARGRAMVERAFEIRPANASAVHALIHAMFEGGAHDDADGLIAAWLPGYDRSGILHGHIAWHAALIALERGDAAQALAIYADSVQPSSSRGMPINIVSDAASLLWRLDAYGHGAPAEAWQTIAAYSANVFPKAGHAFIDAHMALIEATTRDVRALELRVAQQEAMVAAGQLAAGPVVPAITRAADAFARADYRRCIAILEPLSAEWARIGGSGAQREVLEDTLLAAFMRAGEEAKARVLLDRRLARRPSDRDARWRADLSR